MEMVLEAIIDWCEAKKCYKKSQTEENNLERNKKLTDNY